MQPHFYKKTPMSIGHQTSTCVMRICCLLLLFFVGVPWAVFAQGTPGFYKPGRQAGSGLGFRAGLNHSVATVTQYYLNSATFTTTLGGVKARNGLYVSGFYYKDLLTNQVAYRMETNLQLKQTGFVDAQGKPVYTARYYYVGLTPLLGLHLSNKLTVYTGPEINVLLAKAQAVGKGYPLEIGITARLAYSFGNLGAEISYFRGFTKYDRLGDGGVTGTMYHHDFYNQNTQIGLVYHWK